MKYFGAFSYSTVFYILYSLSTAECERKDSQFTPIVMWHGMGDSCCFDFSLGSIKKKLNESMPGIYVHSIKMGSNEIEDVENGFFMHPNKQIEKACEMVRNDDRLVGGFNAIGFSQGAQFLRALVQRCDGIQVKNLISIGGQHQGVYGLPNCASLDHKLCDYIRKLLNHAAYLEAVQNFLVQATYWHNPLKEDEYKKGSTFLSDINNEVNINQTYIDRLMSLEKFVMIKFEKDSMVQPIESEWFGFYKPGQSEIVDKLQDTKIYLDNRLGLQDMEMSNKLSFLSVDGDHLKFDWGWFIENILEPYLR
ncbi:PREDICTED: palmitoyl-protein thioesterase 1 [Nicrophorus vespilloides]|uniref:Palmitoyl-protein thioesterase 1 n=1 Tax=Nicrophorus vespilloides TaxID=110193 RepID=A0ABM1N0L3_NICVS|nr:PREDICTED: palmitoyl-protein thioesterase 1 [Nicrophorus vespilloides]